jgi:hypothetical protein
LIEFRVHKVKQHLAGTRNATIMLVVAVFRGFTV